MRLGCGGCLVALTCLVVLLVGGFAGLFWFVLGVFQQPDLQTVAADAAPALARAPALATPPGPRAPRAGRGPPAPLSPARRHPLLAWAAATPCISVPSHRESGDATVAALASPGDDRGTRGRARARRDQDRVVACTYWSWRS